ncbi:type 4a pilus biogenesis protein PilO [Pseudaquabacterium rugosum]|jgi:type IV pilus assembly protein PilO|nr:type pilus assembly protein PilO [Pseudomonadota bacterium]
MATSYNTQSGLLSLLNTTRPGNLDVGLMFERAQQQFRSLDPNEPGQWPLLPKACAWGAAALAVLAGGWMLVVSPAVDELEVARNQEAPLRAEYRAKLGQAVNLSELRKQKQQVQEYVNQLERQLPGKAEMDALLSDINQAGIGRGLQFELFRPGQVERKEFHAVLPITVRVTGRFHDIGAFTADVANLSRIVTLHNLVIAAPQDGSGTLTMDTIARTYRYLDPEELAEARKVKADEEKARRKGGKP